MLKEVPGFENYKINIYGEVFNKYGKIISHKNFKNSSYFRVYKNGKRYTLSTEKIVNELFYNESLEKLLEKDEVAFKFKDTPYYITNKCRVYNSKSKKFIKTIYRKGYPTFTLYNNGTYSTISIISYLKELGGKVNE